MNPLSHALMLIELFGGVQRLITNASKGKHKGSSWKKDLSKMAKNSVHQMPS